MKALRTLLASKAQQTPAVIALPDSNADQALPPARRTLRKRLAVLLAAIAVPAMAAPGDFGALPGGAPTEAEMVNARLTQQLAENPAMPFERPGMSFPGSAFFFLEDTQSDALIALPTIDPTVTGAEAGRELGELIDAGPSARPFFSGAGLSHARASDCLAQAIWYEAASESEAGQRAVAQVVLNRVAHSSWPGSVCGVVYEGSQRSTGCQFSFTCDGSLARRASGTTWARAQRIAGEALSGSVFEPIGHATHYHTLWVNPYWASSLDHVGTIGAHRFYRNRGAAGEKGAFTGRYAGFEPGVSGRTTPRPGSGPESGASTGAEYASALPDLPAANPRSASPRTGSSTPRSATPTVPAAGPAPILADPAYQGAGQVRDDYAQAGQWKSDTARDALENEQRAIAAEGTARGADRSATPQP